MMPTCDVIPFDAQVVWQTTNSQEIRYDTLCLEQYQDRVLANACDSQERAQAFHVNSASQASMQVRAL